MTSTNRAPRGLSSAGRKLWTDVTGDYELESHELLLLQNCCQTADVVAALQAQLDADGGPVLPVELRRQAASLLGRAPAGAGPFGASVDGVEGSDR